LIAARTLSGAERSLRARVLVLDLDVPGLDGLTLLRQLGSAGVLEGTRAIAVSAPSVGRDAAAAFEGGAWDYVAKPFNIPALVGRIRQALHSARAEPPGWIPAGSAARPEVRG